MDKLYTIHTVKHEEDFFYCLYEENSQQPYDFYYFSEDAENAKKFLENGGAFAGFTPSFVLKQINIVVNESDLNKNFSNII